MSAPTAFAACLDAKATKVNSSAPSTSKWNGVRDVLAEELGTDPEEVYVATISSPSNVNPRFGQSDAARAATVLLAMHTDVPSAVGKTVESLRRLAGKRGAIAAVATSVSGKWEIGAIIAPPGDPHAATLASNYPSAAVIPPT